MNEAASGLVYLFGDEIGETTGGLILHVVTQTSNTITLGWTPVPGAVGYRFSSEKMTKYSHTFDPLRASVRFAKGSAWYRVEALGVLTTGSYPEQIRAVVAWANLRIN